MSKDIEQDNTPEFIDLEDYEDDEFEDDDDYDYEELTTSDSQEYGIVDSSEGSDFSDISDDNDWDFRDEAPLEQNYEDDYKEEDDDEEDEYEYVIVDENGNEIDENEDDEEYYYEEDEGESDDNFEFVELDEDYEDDSFDDYEDEEITDSRANEALEEDNQSPVDSLPRSPLNDKIDGENEELEDSEEPNGDGEPIFEKLLNTFKNRKSHADNESGENRGNNAVATILPAYDKGISIVLEKLSGVPLVGRLFALFTRNNLIARCSPLIIVFIIYGLFFALSFIFGQDKTSTVLLPDEGEVTLTSSGFDKNTQELKMQAENTGGVIVPFSVDDIKLYTFNPGVNPLSWMSFNEIGTCAISETTVEDSLEITASCELDEDVKPGFRTRGVVVEE